MSKSSPHPPPAPPSGSDLEARFDAMVRREYPGLAELAYALVENRADAEEVVQDVLLGVWRHRARFDFDSPVPYLVRAVRNRGLSLRRQRSVRARVLRFAPPQRAEVQSGERSERDELLQALDTAIDELPARCREVFILQRVNGLSYAEIAASLGISRKTVENLMGRTLQRLRAALRGHLGASLLIALATRLLTR
ncbi:MAG TPA: sigma-70 family RNA polymerase sigma factor [Gemmatimonadaceae bacterium]|nr:sigma-70 family RNA polymerase sigma factor [Gemmatimonadaceae bacterium]